MESTSIGVGNPAQAPADLLNRPESRLEAKIRAVQGQSGQSDEKFKSELKTASQEFEAVFIAYLLKVMRDTIEESGFMEGGFGKSIYTELFDQEISVSIARRGMLGISDLIYQKLSTGRSAPEAGKGKAESAKDTISDLQTAPYSQTVKSNENQNYAPEIPDIQLPIQGPVSSNFGRRIDPFSHQIKFHKGIDIAALEGVKVIPALPGTVIFSGYEKGYGNMVLVQHRDGFQTRYGHLGAINVKKGDFVSSKDVLGVVGTSGRSTGPHLHFEVVRAGRHVDPLRQLGPRYAALEPCSGCSDVGGGKAGVSSND